MNVFAQSFSCSQITLFASGAVCVCDTIYDVDKSLKFVRCFVLTSIVNVFFCMRKHSVASTIAALAADSGSVCPCISSTTTRIIDKTTHESDGAELSVCVRALRAKQRVAIVVWTQTADLNCTWRVIEISRTYALLVVCVCVCERGEERMSAQLRRDTYVSPSAVLVAFCTLLGAPLPVCVRLDVCALNAVDGVCMHTNT